MLDPRDADPVTLPLKTQAHVESAALAADDCLAGQSLPLLPALSAPKIPTRIRLLTLQTTLSRKPVVMFAKLLSGALAGESPTRALLLPCLGQSRGHTARGLLLSLSLSAGGKGSTAAAGQRDFAVRPPGPTRATGNRRPAVIPLLPRGSSRRSLAGGPGQRGRHVPQGDSPGGWPVTAPVLPQSPLPCAVRAPRCLPRKARCLWGTAELPAGGQAHGRARCSPRAGKSLVSRLGPAPYCQSGPPPGNGTEMTRG